MLNDGASDTQLAISQHDQLLEFVGNVYGLFGMELYGSSSAQSKADIDTTFTASLDALLGQDLFMEFLRVFDKPQIESRLPRLERYIKLLLSPVTWWKTLLVTALSVGGDCEPRGFNTAAITDGLLSRLLQSVESLLEFSVVLDGAGAAAADDIVDQLCSCVLSVLHHRAASLSLERRTAIARQIGTVLVAMISSHTAVIHERHADLLAASVLAVTASTAVNAVSVSTSEQSNYHWLLVLSDVLIRCRTDAS